MKQNITVEQLKELNKEEFQKLSNLMFSPYLQRISYLKVLKATNQDYIEAAHDINVGRMIEILNNYHTCVKIEVDTQGLYSIVQGGIYNKKVADELCDALWEAIKNILRKKDK